MGDLLPDFPVSDVILDAIEHALGGAWDVDPDGTHHLVGADYSLDQLLDLLAGIDRHDESMLKRLSDPDDPGPAVFEDPRVHYHPNDIIRSLIAEVRRLRDLVPEEFREPPS